MGYEIINNFIPASLYSLKAPHAMDPQYITIHNTANDATAINEINYMHRNKAATSYHVAVDDKHAVQAIPFSRNAWHAGDGGKGAGNRKSIGIEICYSKSGGPKYAAAEENAIEYIAHVLKQYNWGIERVMWHRDWSGKNCPHRIFAEGRADQVKKRIADKLAELKKPAAVKPVSKPAAPVVTPSSTKEEEKLDLTASQRKEIANNFKTARERGVFSSADHEKQILEGTMSQSRLLYLNNLIATAALIGGERNQ